ncbi:hypothetical protein Dimus_037252, partial [Dionaea muscipula]
LADSRPDSPRRSAAPPIRAFSRFSSLDALSWLSPTSTSSWVISLGDSLVLLSRPRSDSCPSFDGVLRWFL